MITLEVKKLLKEKKIKDAIILLAEEIDEIKEQVENRQFEE